jgi:Bacteriophage tail sheath protein
LALTPTYPGVYIQELPSPVHPITGVQTSIAAFVGFAPRGPVNEPTTVFSFGDYSRTFGSLSAASTMSYAVNQFFQNGGTQAVIVRAAHLSGTGTAAKGELTVGSGATTLTLEAANEGAWSGGLLVRIDHDTSDQNAATPVQVNILVKDTATGFIEVMRNLPPGEPMQSAINSQSQLVRATGTMPTSRLPADADVTATEPDPFDPNDPTRYKQFPTSGTGAGADGDQHETDVIPSPPDGTGMYALEHADLFNLLCIPPITPGSALSDNSGPAKFSHDHRALFIVDSDPAWTSANVAKAGLGALTITIGSDDLPYAALYFPRIQAPDPLENNAIVDYPTCGMVAGVMARTDAERGVWKAPAGIEAGLSGVRALTVKLSDAENGLLNPLGVNCLRTFPAAGNVVWGARTLAGADALASQWKYVPVRRTANFIEESLYRGTQWVVFEPNDEPLWSQIRLNVGAFMHDLFRQGAFQGATPQEAYLVKCDKDTTTQTDINNGVVNILVGFAPLKPAEFVIIQIQQLAGQIQT